MNNLVDIDVLLENSPDVMVCKPLVIDNSSLCLSHIKILFSHLQKLQGSSYEIQKMLHDLCFVHHTISIDNCLNSIIVTDLIQSSNEYINLVNRLDVSPILQHVVKYHFDEISSLISNRNNSNP